MAGEVQLFAKNSAGETCLLQLASYDPIKMTLSIADQNPFTPASAYSQTFRIPGQGTNVAFFEDVYSVNGSSFNAGVAAEAWILSDGFLFSVGNLTLKSVVRNEQYSRIEYEVYFLGDTADFVTAVGDAYMNQINTSELDHSLTKLNITDSWGAIPGVTGAGLKDGNVLYPLCEWGYTYDSNNFPTLNTISVGFPKGSTGYYGGSFTRGTTGGLLLTQFKPATRIKWIWDKIFEDAGYTYESEFLNTDLFNNIYMISDSIERPEQEIQAGLCLVSTQADRAAQVGQTIIVPFTFKRSDLDNVFNTETHSWKCPATGTYSFTTNGYGYIGRGSPVPQGAFRVLFKQNGSTIFTSGIYLTPTTASPYTIQAQESISASLVKDDLITVHWEILNFSSSQLLFTRWNFQCTAAADQVIVSSFFPSEGSLRKIDFIKGLTKAFNLVWEPSRDSQKKFVIEPWIDWVQGGTKKDWTDYLDGTKDLVQTPAFLNQPRILKFTGEQDLDFQNEIFQKQYKESWLYRQFNSSINLIRGEQEIKIPFAGIPLQSIPANGTQYPNWVVPSVAKLTTGNSNQPGAGKLQPIRPRPRLVFYNGIITQNIEDPEAPDWYLMNDNLGLTGTAQSVYPGVSEFAYLPPFNGFDPGYADLSNIALNFQNKVPLWSPNVNENLQFLPTPGGTGVVQIPDLYTVFWEDFVEWNYDPYNRRVTAYFRLDPKQIQELKFNDKIWVKDSWYLVEKIYDYPVGEIEIVKVDLIKCPQIGLPLIQTPATGPIPGGEICSSVSLCYTANILDPEITYTYVDCLENLQSVTLFPNTCASVCMLYPPVNALPSGWTAIPNGGCSGGTEYFEEGQDIELRMSATGAAFGNNTRVTLEAATGGPTGTYLPLQYYNWDGTAFLTLNYNVPDGYGAKVKLEWATGFPGQPLVSEEVTLYVDGSVDATATAAGVYVPIEAQFSSAIAPGFVYGATAQIVY